jgi:hypothetical protein
MTLHRPLALLACGYFCWMFTSISTAQQPPAAPKSRMLSVAPGTSVRVPPQWQPSGTKYSNAQELVVRAQARTAGLRINRKPSTTTWPESS